MTKQVRLLTILIAGLLASCAVSRPTTTQIVTDPPLFMVAHPLRYSTYDRTYKIEVPVGFVSDLASIPKWLWWWHSPHEASMAPAIIHDYLYWEQSCTKDEADAVMYLAMRELRVRDLDDIYAGVRTHFAQNAWDRNTQARKRGETRFFTPAYAARLIDGYADPKATWISIQADAREKAGLFQPDLPNAKVKNSCVAALAYFDGLWDKPSRTN